MEPRRDMPTPEEIETLDGTSARRMLAQLTALIATLYALIDELRETIAQQRHQLEQLQRAVFGTSAEKMPSVKRQLNKKRRREETAEVCPERAESATDCAGSEKLSVCRQ